MNQQQAIQVIQRMAQDYRATVGEHQVIQQAITALTPQEAKKDEKK